MLRAPRNELLVRNVREPKQFRPHREKVNVDLSKPNALGAVQCTESTDAPCLTCRSWLLTAFKWTTQKTIQ